MKASTGWWPDYVERIELPPETDPHDLSLTDFWIIVTPSLNPADLRRVSRSIVEHANITRERDEVFDAAAFLMALCFCERLTNGDIQEETGYDPWTIRRYMRVARSAGMVRPYTRRRAAWTDSYLQLTLDAMVLADRIREVLECSLTQQEQEQAS